MGQGKERRLDDDDICENVSSKQSDLFCSNREQDISRYFSQKAQIPPALAWTEFGY